MASLTRKYLLSIGVEEEKADLIVERHSEVLTEIKDERDKYKADAEALPEIQKQLDDLKAETENSKEDAYKVKYEALKEDFEAYKKDIETEKTNASKKDAYKALLKEIGISEKRIDAVAKLAELDKIKLDKDGKIEGANDLKKSLAEEWSDFIVKDGKEGAGTATPPEGSSGVLKTREEIMKIKDTQERQKAWGDYIRNGGN